MKLRTSLLSAAAVSVLLLSGCHQSQAPHATAQDIAAAQQDAQREVADARAEASKDVKSAAKIGAVNPKQIAEAKATGSFDVAMATADGAHKVSTEKCLSLPSDQQPPCKDQADADYEQAKAAAKASRLARTQ